MPYPKLAKLVLPVAAWACTTVPEPLPCVQVGGSAAARVAIGSEPAQGLPRAIEVAAERVFPLAIEFDGCTLRGALGIAYQPRGELALTLDDALLGPAVHEDLTLLGWANDFSGATQLVYLAAGNVDGDALPARDLAERYAGPVSGSSLGWMFLAELLTVGQGGITPGSSIQVRHLEGAPWIEDDRWLRGLREGSTCLFVRPRGGREWIGPLFARGTVAEREGPLLEVDVGAALTRRERTPSCAVGDGVHGQIAARLTTDETDPGLRRLRVDLRGTEQLDAVLVVAAESAAVVGAPSQPGAHAFEAGRGRSVVVWPVALVELARGPLELSYRRGLPRGQVPR